MSNDKNSNANGASHESSSNIDPDDISLVSDDESQSGASKSGDEAIDLVSLLKDKAEKAQQEVEKLRTEIMYQRAEFENFRKRTQKEREELLRFGAERVLREVLEVMDNFERALSYEVTAAQLENFKKGIHMISDELRALLNRMGVQEIPSEHKQFDPNVHEAISTEDSEQHEPGVVLRVLKRAYKLHDRVLRAAHVIVSSDSSGKKN
jgi:molecular chaperone GrpE